jgi:hypothetical protein
MKRLLPAIALVLALSPLKAGACTGSSSTGCGEYSTKTFLTESFLSDRNESAWKLDAGKTASFDFDLAAKGNSASLYNSTTGAISNTATALPDASSYRQSTSSITEAKLFFSFFDNDYDYKICQYSGKKETGYITVTLDGLQLQSNEIEWNSGIYWINLKNYIGYLQDGSFSTAVIETAGDVILADVSLVAATVKKCTPTPIPAAAWLFGSGLLGLVGIRKKKNS